MTNQNFHGSQLPGAPGCRDQQHRWTQAFSLKGLEGWIVSGKGSSQPFHDQGMEFGYAKTVHTHLVVAIMETRVGG